MPMVPTMLVDFPVVVQRPIRFLWSCCSEDHSNSPVAVLGQGDRWPSCTCPLCATTGAQLRVAVAVHQQGCPHPCRGAEFEPHGLQTMEILLLPYTRWSMSLLCRSCEFHSCRREETVVLPQLQLVENIVAMRRRRPCRDAEAVSHGPACLADHRDIPVVLRQGDRRSWCECL